jgi:septum site-determining protein MinC
MHQASERSAPFQLKGGSLSVVILRLLDLDDDAFFAQLDQKVRMAPGLFKNVPLLLDLSGLPDDKAIDLGALTRRLREQKLVPIGVQGGSSAQQEAAIEAGLAVLSGARGRPLEIAEPVPAGSVSSSPPAPAASPPPAPPPPAPAPEPPPEPARPALALVITEPVRSGRKIYSKGDLVVLAPVSQGAELMAEGHIHIYGALRGRALAGASGDASARIFCQSLEAELVSIAGLYRVSEDIDRSLSKKSVQIRLEKDRLRIDALA